MKLTARDREIIASLCCSIRMIALDQVAKSWWPDSNSSIELARRRLAILIENGLITTATVFAAKLPEIVRPIAGWSPGDLQPDFGAIAWNLQSRWKEPPRQCRTYLATSLAAKHFGGRANGKPKHQYQATHDLGLTEVYLRLREDRPELSPHWIGEDLVSPHRRRQKLPDAIIAESPSATPKLIIEFGGSYDKERVTDFHQDCERRALPYEIW